MRAVLLADFGSTYTKLTAVDLETESILGTAQSYTTIETDVMNGFDNAMSLLRQQIGDVEIAERYACSSAAGGLRMVAIGLVPELTAKAARQAALGAGAKVIKTYAYELTQGDLEEIDRIAPDICLLTGGTDGGNQENILKNAQTLAGSMGNFPIIIAGNRSCTDECQKILSGKRTYICENVMPKLGVPNVLPTQARIRSIFLEEIVKAKGLSRVQEMMQGEMMPTPAAMLTAMELLARGTKEERGIDDLVGVDLGGATTDIYSMCEGSPSIGMTTLKGLREGYAKRTVEGDIGMRYSIHGIVEAGGLDRVAELSGLTEDRCRELVEYLATHTDVVPTEDQQELVALDYALASIAVEAAVIRHAGRLEQFFSPMGVCYIQTGKDLSPVKTIVVTGGALIHAKRAGEIASHAKFDPADPKSLRPKEARVLVDRRYILAAMGLLSTVHPDTALRIMKRELKEDGLC